MVQEIASYDFVNPSYTVQIKYYLIGDKKYVRVNTKELTEWTFGAIEEWSEELETELGKIVRILLGKE